MEGFSMGSDYYVEYFSSVSLDSKIRDRLSSIEGSFSIRAEGSFLSKINESSKGESITLTEEESEVLKRCFELAGKSGEAFSPTLYPLVELWGFNPPDYEMNGKIPPDEQRIQACLKKISTDGFSLTEEGALTKINEGAALDLGGAIKGYAAEQVRDLLEEKGATEALVYVGGTIAAVGRDYRIGVTSPRGSQADYAFSFSLSAGEICATSGDYERCYFYQNKRYHHILNGKTGYPADSGIISATIISEDGLLADALATAVVVLGEEKGLSLVRSCGAKAALITSDNRVVTSRLEIILKDTCYEVR